MADSDMYTSAHRLIKRHGPQATEHAKRMLRRCLEKDDPQEAGMWLTIGQAIEDLTWLSVGVSKH